MKQLKLPALGFIVLLSGGLWAAAAQKSASAPQSRLPQLNSTGQVSIEGNPTPYLIRRLPVSSFPGLPDGVQEELTRRGCLIPQTYEAHQPENVVQGSFERTGSSDWAALCSAEGTVSLLVFFADRPADEPIVLASTQETERLQPHHPDLALGFNWSIAAASPQQVHESQAGLDPRPPRINHDALADSTVDRRTVYHFFAKGSWTLLETP